MSSQRYTPEFKDEAVRQVLQCEIKGTGDLLKLILSVPIAATIHSP